ncbi:MAG: 2-oxoacid ferredoxin oxidoreductase, partial [Spirochaetaceae bacterium]
DGVFDAPLNPLILSIAAGATFVARGFAGDVPHLTGLMAEAITHKGFAVIDVLQPCVTFNKEHTYDWFRQRLYKLDPAGYTPDNKLKAIEKAMEWGDKIPYGIFYKEVRPASEDHEPALKAGPLARQPLGNVPLDDVLSEFI